MVKRFKVIQETKEIFGTDESRRDAKVGDVVLRKDETWNREWVRYLIIG
jgi:hypothetical protein